MGSNTELATLRSVDDEVGSNTELATLRSVDDEAGGNSELATLRSGDDEAGSNDEVGSNSVSDAAVMREEAAFVTGEATSDALLPSPEPVECALISEAGSTSYIGMDAAAMF